MIRGDFLKISEKDLNDTYDIDINLLEYKGDELYDSRPFREVAVNQGYKLLKLYPIYHQGWEMDSWGAIGIKDGKKYILETTHGQLEVHPVPSKIMKKK
jgi:hypothetical protein